MGRLLRGAVVVLLTFCMPGCLGCPSQKTQSEQAVERTQRRLRMHQILNEAKASNGSGTMHLGGYGIGPSAMRNPASEWPPQTKIFRAPEGGTLLLPCNNTQDQDNLQVSHSAIPPAFTYNGHQVSIDNGTFIPEPTNETYSCCNCTKEVCAAERFEWSLAVNGYDEWTGAFTIELMDFSYVHTGLYECLHSKGSQLVATQSYWVSPTLFRHDVFHPPMQNVTARYGDPAEMVCPVRFTFLPGELSTRFLWRKGSYLLFAKSIPSVADAALAFNSFNGSFHFGEDEQCRCNSTMVLQKVTWEHTGWYECWFRINDQLDNWVVQEAYLRVI